MAELIVYIVLGLLLLGGVAALARPRTISEEEYESMKGRTSMVGNAMHAIQDVLAPSEAEALRKAKAEMTEEQPSGDPPPDDTPDGAPPGAGDSPVIRS